jgi:hypothetical protein
MTNKIIKIIFKHVDNLKNYAENVKDIFHLHILYLI